MTKAQDSHISRAEQPWEMVPRQRSFWAGIREAFGARRLLMFFAHSAIDRLVRRTFLGRFWLFVRPAMVVLPYFFFFSQIMQVETAGAPFPIFLLAGMLPWLLFDQGVTWGTRALEANRSILKQKYLPRLILPLAFMAPAALFVSILAGFFVALILIYWAMTGSLYFNLSLSLLWVIPGFLLPAALALGFSLFTSVWGSRYRDIRFSLRYVTSFWSLITPVAYGPEKIAENLQWLLVYNPMAQPVLMVRGGLLGLPFDPGQIWFSAVFCALLLVGGVIYFLSCETATIDRI